jgi:nicotinamidase/pyrazinamidase
MVGRYGPGVALVVIDMQNDFATPGGSLYVQGGEGIVDAVNAEVAAAAEAGSPVFYTQDWHPEQTPHFVTAGGVWPVHCVHDTPGAALHPRLTVVGPVIRKGADGSDGYSGFSVRDPASGERSATELGHALTAGGIHTVVVVGLAGDYCVKETALDAVSLGFRVLVPLPLTRFVNSSAGDDDRAVAEMAAAGVDVISTSSTGRATSS